MDQSELVLSPSGSVQANMFQSASNIAINGGQFSVSQTIYGPTDAARLAVVYTTGAPNAILNAGGRADEVRCYPGTRAEVIAKCESWMDSESQPANTPRGGSSKIFWLSGPAGAGKSAIVQTLAGRCIASRRPMANFFFFRNDSSRSNATPLVATLLWQLFELCEGLKPEISAVLNDRPAIFRQSLRDQFQYLIDNPVRSFRDSSSLQTPIVLLIDGLDECSSETKHEQQLLLRVLHDLVSRDDSAFLVLVASRAEPHLIMTFKEVGSSSKSIFLDDEYRPQDDIRLFVVAELDRIKRTHHLGRMLPANWPPQDHIDQIVNKSSGQFIYAATVMRFIADSPASPAHSLDVVQGLRPVKASTPFAELDAIYLHILSHAYDWDSAKDVLAVEILRNSDHDTVRREEFLTPLGYEADDIPSAVAGLTSLVKSEYGSLAFYHASFPDFLQDKARSGDFYIDPKQFADTWATAFIKAVVSNESLKACRIVIENVSGPTPTITDAWSPAHVNHTT